MKLFVGIDVSSEKLDVCFLDSHDTTLKEITLSNDLNGAKAIQQGVLQFHETFSYEKIVIGMESTSIYSFHPATFLHEDQALKSLGIVEVVVQNPTVIHRYKNVFVEDKNDRLDAFRIADFLRIERYSKPLIREEKYVALQRLTRSRYQLVCQLTECKQHFLENLYYKCNTISKELKSDNKSVFGATMMDLLSDSLSLDEIALMDIIALFEVIPEAKCLESIPGIGIVYTAGIIAEIGQIKRFEDDAKLAKYAGLYWKKSQSGNFESQRTPMTRTGNHYLRYYLVEAPTL